MGRPSYRDLYAPASNNPVEVQAVINLLRGNYQRVLRCIAKKPDWQIVGIQQDAGGGRVALVPNFVWHQNGVPVTTITRDALVTTIVKINAALRNAKLPYRSWCRRIRVSGAAKGSEQVIEMHVGLVDIGQPLGHSPD